MSQQGKSNPKLSCGRVWLDFDWGWRKKLPSNHSPILGIEADKPPVDKRYILYIVGQGKGPLPQAALDLAQEIVDVLNGEDSASKRMWATIDVESGDIQDVHPEYPGRIAPAYRGILRNARVEVKIVRRRCRNKK